ncbi:MAG: hypothetical protein GF329_05340 [Candidatus Lokiarchaeota archaeon]|nr:hypothetical protein [Candidatus Lokiarchaeota archaeon]
MEGRKIGSYKYTKQDWNLLINLCKEFTSDSFIAIPAYEWSGRLVYTKSFLNQECHYEAISDKIILFPLENAIDAPLVDYISKDGCFQKVWWSISPSYDKY